MMKEVVCLGICFATFEMGYCASDTVKLGGVKKLNVFLGGVSVLLPMPGHVTSHRIWEVI